MRALIIGSDPHLFEVSSPVRRRVVRYATAVGELYVLSRAPLGTVPVHEGALHLYPYAGWPMALRCMYRAWSLVRSQHIDIVSAQDPFEFGLIAWVVARITHRPLHIQIHTDVLSPWFAKSSFRRRMQVILAHWLIPRADRVRVVSVRIKQSLEARFGNRLPPLSVIPAERTRRISEPRVLPVDTRPLSAVTVGRLELEKDLVTVITGFARAVRACPTLTLIIVGEGKMRRRLEALVQRLNLVSSVRFVGWHTDVPELLRSADFYVQASLFEGYSFSLLEAAEAHLPIITTDVGIVGEVLPRDCVLSIPQRDPEALGEACCRLVLHPEYRKALADAAYEAVRTYEDQLSPIPALVSSDLFAAVVTWRNARGLY